MGSGSYTQELINKLTGGLPGFPRGSSSPTTGKKKSPFDEPPEAKKVTEAYWGADGKFHIIYSDGTMTTTDAPPPPPKGTAGGGGFSISDVGPVSAQLQRDQLTQAWDIALAKIEEERQARLQAGAQFSAQQAYLQDKLRIDTQANDRAEMRATQQLLEQMRTRIDANNLAQQRLIVDAQQLQAQMNFQAAQANARNQMEAAQFNEQARQANVSQQRQVAGDIASFSRSPGDVGANAAYLMAGSSAPISRAIATGQDARTDQSLMPLDLLLQSRDELAKGPTPFIPRDVVAPTVPIPTSTPQQMPQLPPEMMGQRPAPAPQPTLSTGTPQQSSASIQDFLRQGAGGGTFSSDGNNFRIDERGNLVVVPAANGFFGTVSDPTLFLAGEKGAPETVSITPQSTTPQPTSTQPTGQSRSRDFLNEAFRKALGNSPWAKTGTPTPVGVSAPGTNPFLQEMASALAAIGQGINPALFLREAMMATPQGISGSPMRRTR